MEGGEARHQVRQVVTQIDQYGASIIGKKDALGFVDEKKLQVSADDEELFDRQY